MKLIIILLAVLHLIHGQHDIMFTPKMSDEAVRTINPYAKPAVGEQCNDVDMNMCQHRFNEFLGISGDADFHNWEILRKDIQDLLNKSVDDGLLKVCQARSLFYQCLGSRYSNCMSIFHFLGHGMDTIAATRFVQTFNELEFMCNGGLLQSIQKWTCIRNNLVQAQQYVVGCDNYYTNMTHWNPSGRCDYAEGYMLCYRVPFYKNCGEDVAWWSCEQARVALNIDDYCPHLSCSYDTFGPTVAPTGTHPAGGWVEPPRPEPALMTRRELFRSANPQFMSQEKQNLFIQLGAKAAERARKKRSVEDEE